MGGMRSTRGEDQEFIQNFGLKTSTWHVMCTRNVKILVSLRAGLISFFAVRILLAPALDHLRMSDRISRQLCLPKSGSDSRLILTVVGNDVVLSNFSCHAFLPSFKCIRWTHNGKVASVLLSAYFIPKTKWWISIQNNDVKIYIRKKKEGKTFRSS
jgi:hypothetical protein